MEALKERKKSLQKTVRSKIKKQKTLIEKRSKLRHLSRSQDIFEVEISNKIINKFSDDISIIDTEILNANKRIIKINKKLLEIKK